MTHEECILNDYFEWMYNLACGDKYADGLSHRKLLSCLHDIEFIYFISKDKNRAADGEDLRYRYSLEYYDGNVPECLDGPCSVFEMMLALALRCEETIMDDPAYGDRTRQWFWGMITNLGLGSMIDDRFDEEYVRETVDRFLYREYEADGRGGLFTVRHCDKDLRTVEIWYQLCWYLDAYNF